MKHTLLIFGLLWALGASGQIYINSYAFGAAPSANLLLDDYPNAAAAYSLRKLRTAYTGDCIEVRRSLDNTTSNIGFSGGVIDTAALKTFCASTDCFVRTWYDQSTNSRDATQTTNADQPQIVRNGNILYRNNKPAVFAISNDFLRCDQLASAVPLTSNFTKFSVMHMNGTGGALRDLGFGRSTSNTSLNYHNIDYSLPANLKSIADYRTDANVLARVQHNDADTSGIFTYQGLSTLQSFFNGTSRGTIAKPSGAVTIDNVSLFATRSAPVGFSGGEGVIHEVIIYASNMSSDRSAIILNINGFYSLY